MGVGQGVGERVIVGEGEGVTVGVDVGGMGVAVKVGEAVSVGVIVAGGIVCCGLGLPIWATIVLQPVTKPASPSTATIDLPGL